MNASIVLDVFDLLPVKWRFFKNSDKQGRSSSTFACQLRTTNFIVNFKLFHSALCLWMPSPTFLGDNPDGPIIGARDDVAWAVRNYSEL